MRQDAARFGHVAEDKRIRDVCALAEAVRAVDHSRMPKKLKVRWADEPETHDYAAAESYLTLLVTEAAAKRIVAKLETATMTEFKAKDVFRASALPLLSLQNAHVKQDERRILAGEKLSPILLVRDPAHGRLLIADGYHRMCAVYAFNEDAVVPCKIV